LRIAGALHPTTQPEGSSAAPGLLSFRTRESDSLYQGVARSLGQRPKDQSESDSIGFTSHNRRYTLTFMTERLDDAAFNISSKVIYKIKYFYLIVNKAIKLFYNIFQFNKLRFYRLNRILIIKLKLIIRYAF
jgi:hypothetical protein